MTDIVVAKPRKSHARPDTVQVKTIITDEGTKARVYTVSGNSPNLGQDLLYAFRKSVEKTREENLKLFGSRSGK